MQHDLICQDKVWGVILNMESALTYDQTKAGPGRPRAPRSETPNLISSWRTFHGELDLAALDTLNEDLGSRYIMSRVAEWERGGRQPNAAVVNYMIADVLPGLLKEAGLTEDVASRITDMVTLPEPRH